MKYIPLILLLFASHYLTAQSCNDSNHSININDSWVSCQKSTNPNPVRGNSHWIQYDFGYAYYLGTTHLWNYNVAGETGKGMKNLTIDYSMDGVTWTELTTHFLGMASGTNSYTGEAGPDFNNIAARYVLISSIDSWGSTSCAGLSEARFDVQGVVSNETAEDEDTTIKLFPNPADEYVTIVTDQKLKELILLGVAGNEITRFEYTSMFDVSYLVPGTYLLKCVGTDNQQITKRFVVF